MSPKTAIGGRIPGKSDAGPEEIPFEAQAADLPLIPRKLLGHSAWIPCLLLVASGVSGQSDLITRLHGKYAPNTIVDSLAALAEAGLVDRKPREAPRRGVEHFITPAGTMATSVPLKALLIQGTEDQPLRRPRVVGEGSTK